MNAPDKNQPLNTPEQNTTQPAPANETAASQQEPTPQDEATDNGDYVIVGSGLGIDE